MPIEVLKAVITLVQFYMKQDNCKTCPMRKMCGKMPCEIDLF